MKNLLENNMNKRNVSFKVREIRNAVELMVGRLENQLKNKVLTLMNQRNKLSQETDCMDTMMLELEKELRTKTKSELITRQPAIIKKFQQLTARNNSMTSFAASISAGASSSSSSSSTTISANLNDFVSEIVPAYDSSTFTIKNFSQLKLKADPIYSPPLNVITPSFLLKISSIKH